MLRMLLLVDYSAPLHGDAHTYRRPVNSRMSKMMMIRPSPPLG